jgi:hypothetical protein
VLLTNTNVPQTVPFPRDARLRTWPLQERASRANGWPVALWRSSPAEHS